MHAIVPITSNSTCVRARVRACVCAMSGHRNTWSHGPVRMLWEGLTMPRGMVFRRFDVQIHDKSDMTHACTHARTHARTHAYTHTRTHACTHARTRARMHACMHARMHARTHAGTHACTRARARTHASNGLYFASINIPTSRAALRIHFDIGVVPKTTPTIRSQNRNAKSEPRQSGLTLCVPVSWPEFGLQKRPCFEA